MACGDIELIQGDPFSHVVTLYAHYDAVNPTLNVARNLSTYSIAVTLETMGGLLVATPTVQILDQATNTGCFLISIDDTSRLPLTTLRGYFTVTIDGVKQPRSKAFNVKVSKA